MRRGECSGGLKGEGWGEGKGELVIRYEWVWVYGRAVQIHSVNRMCHFHTQWGRVKEWVAPLVSRCRVPPEPAAGCANGDSLADVLRRQVLGWHVGRWSCTRGRLQHALSEGVW